MQEELEKLYFYIFFLFRCHFNDEQIDCICDSLQQRGDVSKLENFLQMLEATEKNTGKMGSKITEAVMRAKAFVAFERGRYRELYNIIETREFAQKYHPQLQDMWYRAHYKEAEGVRGRALGKNFFLLDFFWSYTRCYLTKILRNCKR